MTSSVRQSLPHSRPGKAADVAAGVAARALDLAGADGAGAASAGPIGYEIGWAGPVDLPLSDERAVQAACGIMHVHGRAAGRPAPLAVDYASTVAGVLAAQGVLAALIARSRGLEVTGVRTSVGQAALLALTQYLAAATAADDDWQEEHGSGSPAFASADGVRFEFETLDPEPWREFWQQLGADPADIARGWPPFQQRYATAACPLPAALHELVRGEPFTVISAAADSAGAAVLPVGQDPHSPVAARPWTLAPSPEPVPGGTDTRPGPPPPQQRPLEGVRVIESARRVQGPMAGHILRMLGADVVRVEPPGRDPMRGIPPIAGACSARFSALNTGKSVTEIDIKSAAGRSAVHELVAGADVFLHNWAPGKAAQLRLDADDLRRTRPGLVYAWASGWHDGSHAANGSGAGFGPAPPPGTDFLVQAHGGLAAALRPADEDPAPSLMTLTDVLGGLVCAQGVLAALLARVRTGGGGRVDSSLFSAAAMVPRPRRRVVWGVLDRPVRTEDGYLALGGEARAYPGRVAAVAGLGASAGAAGIAARFRARPTGTWLSRLAEAGLRATPVCTDLAALADDPRFNRALGSAAHAFPLAPWGFS
ncbi:CoA transferase [Streptomyces sp. 8N616]|uniref:CoA transferase n=1 Tax=Streptomyces sp. 8N616 TaxID=3457414 RepID=UPI003FD203D4